jgi:UDPglucose 6-dehydrogenase
LNVCVVGIGRIGLPLAVALSKYYPTVGVDVDPSAVERVNSGVGFAEPLVEEYLGKYKLKASLDFSELERARVVFICVGSQAPGIGYASDRFMSALSRSEPHMVSHDQLLVFTTTLPPRDFREKVVPFLKRTRLEERLAGICYNPAMVALGKTVADFEKPNYMLIGESNPEAGRELEAFWRKVVGQEIPVHHGKMMDVAVAKYALNTALVAKISLLSFLTEFCEKEGSNIDLLASILKGEPRVAGDKMFKGGLGYGGTCFPVDIQAVKYECEQLGIPPGYPDALTSLNDWQVERSVRLLSSLGKKKVSVLGLSFKADTDVVVGSQSLMIAEKLADQGLDVMVHDPKAMANARDSLGSKVRYAKDIEDAAAYGDIIFVGVEWPQYRSLGDMKLRRDQIVVDPWRIFGANPPPCVYVPFGVGRS